jgi:DNA-binding GntR family transcriptional regulator
MMPAREALRRLVAEKALELPHNRRSARVPILSADRMNELWRVRLALEGLAAEVAGAKATPADVEEIALIQLRLAAARKSRDYTAIMLHNFNFHHALYRLANMPYLLSLIESLWLNVGPLLSKLYSRGLGTQLHGDAHHAEVIKALRSADPLAVRQAVERDLAQALPHLLEIIASLAHKEGPVESVVSESSGDARISKKRRA